MPSLRPGVNRSPGSQACASIAVRKFRSAIVSVEYRGVLDEELHTVFRPQLGEQL
jgi:hypothetical protein